MKTDKETKEALAKATVEKVLNVILSKYFTGRGFLLKQEPKICYKQIQVLEEHIYLKNLECFFVDIFNGERLAEQLEVAVKSNRLEVAYSEKKLAELVLKFDVLNTKADQFGYKDRPIRAHLRLKFYNNIKAKESIPDLLLRPKKRIVLPATQLDWGKFDFDDTSLYPKINTQKARIREYNECKELLRKYQQELNNTTREYDFGIREDNLVYEVPKVLNFETFSF